MARYGYWCKNGCGKKVIFTGWNIKHKHKPKFTCTECGRKYKDIEEVKG